MRFAVYSLAQAPKIPECNIGLMEIFRSLSKFESCKQCKAKLHSEIGCGNDLLVGQGPRFFFSFIILGENAINPFGRVAYKVAK